VYSTLRTDNYPVAVEDSALTLDLKIREGGRVGKFGNAGNKARLCTCDRVQCRHRCMISLL